MPRVFISLGSNMGEPVENLKKALEMMEEHPGIRISSVSSLYLTEPVGFEDQPWFHNCVAEVFTELEPEELLKALQGIENHLGRVRTLRWGPRTLDLDILMYDSLIVETKNLSIPHPRMREREFVMVPLTELAPDAEFPDGVKVLEARKNLESGKKYSCITKKIW